ncbi:MAG: NADH-quinone oxidoreductase subunit M [Actinomycetales bacterium]|nr:NADH-quinone oxidoreductase subunit M [Actinomycetales bacterium]
MAASLPTAIPWTVLIVLVPLIGAVAVTFLRAPAQQRAARWTAFGASLLALLLAVILAIGFTPAGPGVQYLVSSPWLPALGVSLSFGVTGISLVMVLLTTVLAATVIAAEWRMPVPRGTTQGYLALLLSLEALVLGVFLARDLFVFYVLFEAMLLPVYFLIGRFGGSRRGFAAVKFLVYSLVGGLAMLAALIGLFVESKAAFGRPTFDMTALADMTMSTPTERLIWWGFFLAFAIKAPLVPLHTWLPDAAAESTPGTATMLIGVLDKVGVFGMLVILLPLLPNASVFYAPMVVVLALIGILYGAVLAIGQGDMKRLFAYTSVSHFGFIVLGVFVFTGIAMNGAIFYMVAHGLSTAGLFLVAGYLMSQRGSASISAYGGVSQRAPLLAGLFLVMALSTLALPGLAGFIGEFLVLLGAFQRSVVVGVIATTGIVLAAIYMLWLVQRVMVGPLQPGVDRVREVTVWQAAAVGPLVALLLLLGFFPQTVLSLVEPAAQTTLAGVPAGTAATPSLFGLTGGEQP